MISTTQTAAGEIAFEVIGHGPPVMLIPGFMSSSTGWKVAGYPEQLSDFQLILVDPLGHGASDKSHEPGDYSIANTVAQISAVLESVGVGSAAMVGFSRGALIAAQMVAFAPELVTAAVFGAAPLGRSVKTVVEEQRPGLVALRASDWPAYWSTFPVPIPEVMQQAFSQSNDPLALAAALEAMLAWGDEEPELGVKATEVPCMAYFGTGEVFADRLRDVVDAAGLDYVERDWAGHAETMMDVGGVSGIVHDFLAPHLGVTQTR